MDSSLSQYMKLLKRAKSFKNLLFYNKQLVDPYLIACYGFHLVREHGNKIHKDHTIMAKCEQCRYTIKFDQIHSQFFESKQPLRYTLKNHQEQCVFHNLKQKGELLEINIKSITEYGPKLYYAILDKYHRQSQINQQVLQYIDIDIASIINDLDNKSRQCLNYFWQNSSYKSKKKQCLALLGWTIDFNQNKAKLTCEYCGNSHNIRSNKDSYDIINLDIKDSHKAYCAIIVKKVWKLVLDKIVVMNLEKSEGQFLKTQAMKYAKKLELQIEQIYNSKKDAFMKLSSELNRVKESCKQKMSENPQKQGQLCETFKRISNIAQQMRQQFESISKKIKIN